jgi:hypothetical protein
MNYENKDEKFEKINILENAIIIFKGKLKRLFDAIQITNEGVITGFILNKEVFVENGFIPEHKIIRIEGGIKKEIYKRKY